MLNNQYNNSIQERGNYRPISVLPILSKPLERHVASAYLQFLTSNNLLYGNQSAYRPHHSCETALLNISDNWLKAMDNSELVGTVFLDLSKAFDLVNHDILLYLQNLTNIILEQIQWTGLDLT